MAIASQQPFFQTCHGPEFIAQKGQDWITAIEAKTAYIERGSPSENGYCENFNAWVRDELLNGEIFYSLREAQILIQQWRINCNNVRPHSVVVYRPPAPESIDPMDQRPTTDYQSNRITRWGHSRKKVAYRNSAFLVSA